MRKLNVKGVKGFGLGNFNGLVFWLSGRGVYVWENWVYFVFV